MTYALYDLAQCGEWRGTFPTFASALRYVIHLNLAGDRFPYLIRRSDGLELVATRS